MHASPKPLEKEEGAGRIRQLGGWRETLDSALINADCQARRRRVGEGGGEKTLGWHQMEQGLVKGQG